ncbi:MAG: zinc-dependent alcohol dehydrogenase family protein [Pseudomonadota bacterium]
MRMTAAVLYDQGKPRPYADSKPLVIEEVELDPPGPGELLIEIGGAGLCHSDLSTIEGLRPRILPAVGGHEGAGIVRALGEGVTGLAVGDHVVTLFVSSCGNCRYCAEGRPNLCNASLSARTAGTLISGARRLRFVGDRPGRDGAALLHHYSNLSVFAEYAVVSQSTVVKIDRDVPLDVAAIFGCAVMTGVGAVLNTARVPAGGNMAVVGLGGVGMCALLGGVVAGAARLVAVDVNPDKLGLARQLGATDTMLASDADCVAQIRELTQGGLDTVIETAGTMPAMQTAYAITARGGTTVSVGLPQPNQLFQFAHSALVSDERTIKGSYMGSCVPKRDIPRFIELYKRGKLPIDRLRSGTLNFDGINAGFDRLADGAVLRQVLVPGG